MKIVFFMSSFNMGGAEKHALLLADYYKNHLGWDTEVWGWSELNGPIPSMCKKINVKPIVVEQWEYSTFLQRKLLERKYKKRLKGVDVVMSFNNRPNIFCAEFLKFTGVKLHIWAQQGIDGYDFPKNQQKIAIEGVKCVISNSQNGVDFLVKKVGFKAEQCFVVHNGIDINPPERAPEKWIDKLGLNQPDSFSGAMIANITRLKDHITLIAAWAIVVKELNKEGVKANLYLAGRKDNMYEESRLLVTKLGLEDNVTFLGVVKDVNNLVESMDLTILSSPSEGLPNAVLEAMLLGKPFVGTNIPGIREAVGEHNFQYLVSEKDEYELASMILKFARDKSLQNEVGENNRKWVRENFPIEKLWTKTHQIIMENLK